MYPPRSVVCVSLSLSLSLSAQLPSHRLSPPSVSPFFQFFHFFHPSFLGVADDNKQTRWTRQAWLSLYNTTGKLEGSKYTLFFLENRNLPSLTLVRT